MLSLLDITAQSCLQGWQLGLVICSHSPAHVNTILLVTDWQHHNAWASHRHSMCLQCQTQPHLDIAVLQLPL